MKKYLLITMFIMSVIFVIPAMAETDDNAATTETQAVVETQPAAETQAETETQPAAETQAETETQPAAETKAEIGPHVAVEARAAAEAQNGNVYIAPTAERRIGPGEFLASEAAETTAAQTTTAETTEETAASTEAVVNAVPMTRNRWGVVLNSDERDLLARITMLESGGESSLGQQAVVEVILNRVYSPSYPNTVYGVLSQVDCGYRQFSTWKNRNSRAATPSARVLSNVDAVLNGETNILPYNTVYFSRKAANKRVQARIGNHVFCNR